MNKKWLVFLTVAALVAGCSGGDDDGTTGGGTVPGTGGATSKWASVKIGGGGYVPGLIFHPTTPNLLYARTDIGGAYRWNSQTSSWVAITDGFGPTEGFYMGGESIALDPNDDRLVYMSTGMYNSHDGSGRLYISSDRGDHWSYVQLPFSVGSNNGGRAIGERMMVDPNLPSTLFYGSRTAGLWKSADSGRSWSQVTSLSATWMSAAQITASEGSAKGVEFVVYDTSTKGTGTATQTIYVGVAPDYAAAAGLGFNLYRSTDAGQTWSGVTTPVNGSHIPHIARAADGVFYLAFTHGAGPGAGGPASLYKFNGSQWTLLKNTVSNQFTSFGFGGLSVHGSGPSTRIALGITNSWGNWDGQPVVALSDDAGTTWREIASTMPHLPADGSFSGWVDDVEIDPSNRDHILHVHGGGVWATLDASASRPTWLSRVDGIEETATVSMVAPPTGASYLLLNSAMDIGMVVHTAVDQSPTLGPHGNTAFGTGFSADMAWSTPSYIVSIGATVTNSSVLGAYSTDSGRNWSPFATSHPDAMANQSGESNIAVTAPNHAVWSAANSVPYYTTDNGAHWAATNLPALVRLTVNRAYHVAADRRNPNKVYAYDSGGAWWGTTPPQFYYSTDAGHTFTRSQAPALSDLHLNNFQSTTLAVNPNAEGDVWLADGNSLYHSVDSGITWSKLSTMQSVWGSHPTWETPELYGATTVALGKAAPGATYSATVYIVGTVDGVWGVHRSDDTGATWTRINDDQHQYGGIQKLAADPGLYGRLYIGGGGRGVLVHTE